MDTNFVLSAFNEIYNDLIKNEDYDRAIDKLNSMKINSYVKYLLYGKDRYSQNESDTIAIIIKILQLIYNNSGLESPVPDEEYDKLYELNRSLNESEIVGSINASDRNILQHRYPELRGTLNKVHFITIEQKIAVKDKRKSIEDWVNSIENIIGRKLTDDECRIDIYPKWDGISVILECNELGVCERALSRGDVEKNEAIDLSAMFKGISFLDLIWKCNDNKKFGLKTEVIMSNSAFDELIEREAFKNPRSAVSSILNSKELDREYLKYLTVIPLQVQLEDDKRIIIPPEVYKFPYSMGNLKDLEFLEALIYSVKKSIEKDGEYNIDGVVIRIMDKNIQSKLGREDNINKYEIAFKFSPESKETILKDIKFSVGSLGSIRPVAIIEPVKIKGNTITNISLGSIDRFESLNLHKGDAVLIKYDVIPYLDAMPNESLGEKFITPTDCPSCGNNLVKEPILKCINNNCDFIQIGKVINYITKMNIANIDEGKVVTLFEEGVIKSIQDLYNLKKKKSEIISLKGFGEKSFKKILDGVNARLKVYDYEALGSIGITDIGRKIFNKILDIYYIDELIDIAVNNKTEKLTVIQGIKDKTAEKIMQGIRENLELIKFLCSTLKLEDRNSRKYTIKVCFTKVRDRSFELFLLKKNVLVLEKYSKEVDILIVKSKNDESDKIEKARKHGKEIITIDEAYKMFAYK